MSETNNTIVEQLIDIKVPNINSADYANQLDNVFTGIDTNFKILASDEFVKGDKGDSVKLKEVDLFDENGNLTGFGNKLISAIENNSEESERADITMEDGSVLSWKDYFNNNPGKLYVIYDSPSTLYDADIAYSSLYYTFLDGRYVNNHIGKLDPKEYQAIKDLSCILVYSKELNNEEGGFNIVSNSLPTIYYEEGIGLCWKVNGANTGIPVQGIPGKNGNNALIYVVQANIAPTENNNESKGAVTHVFEPYSGFINITEDIDISVYDNAPAIILGDNNGSNNVGKEFYIGILKVEKVEEKSILNAYCAPSTSINVSASTESFINSMKLININGISDSASSTPKGIFIPMEDENDSKQAVHLMSATSITNEKNSVNDVKTDLIFTPVKDYNGVEINTENENNIIVDKYLYLRINMNNNTIVDNLDSTIKAPYNGVLKYKLESNVTSLQSVDFNVYNINENTGSRFFGNDKLDKNNRQFTDSNTAYINPTKNNEITTNHLESMSDEFRKRLESSDNNRPVGIYKWVLCNEPNNWDVDELISENTESYNFDNIFKVVFTTDITPSATSTFLWFDGYTYASNDYRSGSDENNKNLYYEKKSIIRGWNNTDSEMFSFIKFVPIYKNSYALSNDTSLNLNYNVNITGDALNPTKSINIHGNVNCDNLSVYKLTATGAIQNIYTEDTIVGDKGIKLCADNDNNDKYNFIVEDGGDVIAKSGIRTTSLNCTTLKYEPTTDDWYSEVNSEEGTVTAKHLKSDDAIINELIVNTKNGNVTINSSESNNVSVNIDNTDSININSVIVNTEEVDKKENHNSKLPVLTSNMPTHLNAEANIIVSNQPKGSELLYFRNVKADIDTKKIAGTGIDVDNISFESAKNFNIHRFHVGSTSSQSVKIALKGSGFNTGDLHNPPYERLLFYEGKQTGEIKRSSDNITLNNINDVILQKYTIQSSGYINGYNTAKLDPTSDIKIKFDKTFKILAAIKGCCDNGRWPVLLNTNSYVKLSAYIKYKEAGVDKIENIKDIKTYRFSNTNGNDNWNHGNGKEWKGHTYNGKDFDNKYYSTAWRYYTYLFKPYDITLPSDRIIELLNTEGINTIELFITAEGSLHAKGQSKAWPNRDKAKEVISGLWLGVARPINEAIDKPNETISVTAKDSVNFTAATDGSTIELQYILSMENNVENSVKSTIICNDGIVTRAGNYTFGLGHSAHFVNHSSTDQNTLNGKYTYNNGLWDNSYIKEDHEIEYNDGEPVLFYYDSKKFAEDYNSTNGDLTTTKKGYGLRVNTIRLKEIFETIQRLRSNENYMYGI